MLPEPRESAAGGGVGVWLWRGSWCWASGCVASFALVGGVGAGVGLRLGWGSGFRIGCGGLHGGAAGQVGDAEVGAVLVAGQADGGDPGGALVDEDRRGEAECSATEAAACFGVRRGWRRLVCLWYCDGLHVLLSRCQLSVELC